MRRKQNTVKPKHTIIYLPKPYWQLFWCLIPKKKKKEASKGLAQSRINHKKNNAIIGLHFGPKNGFGQTKAIHLLAQCQIPATSTRVEVA